MAKQDLGFIIAGKDAKLFRVWVIQESLMNCQRELMCCEHFSHQSFLDFGLKKVESNWCVKEKTKIIHVFDEESCNAITAVWASREGEYNLYDRVRDALQIPGLDYSQLNVKELINLIDS